MCTLFDDRTDNMPESDIICYLLEDIDKIEKDDVLIDLPQEYRVFLKDLQPLQITSNNVKDIEWNRYGILENKISETIMKCDRLKDENADLKQQIEWGVQEQEEEEKEGKELNTEEDSEPEQENVKSGFRFEIG